MNFNYNIPPKQRRTHQLVAQFNADEEFWFSWKASAAVVASSIHGCPVNLKDSLICWNLPGHGRRKTVSVFGRQTLTQNRSFRAVKTDHAVQRAEYSFRCFENSRNMKYHFTRSDHFDVLRILKTWKFRQERGRMHGFKDKTKPHGHSIIELKD